MVLTISVCIPCIEEHISVLGRCIKSISDQTLLPLEVIISLSSISSSNKIKEAESIIQPYRDKLTIIILYTDEKKYAGENRNITIDNASGDIISFIDADDIMYSSRLNFLAIIFHISPNCMCVLHYFTENVLNKKEPEQIFDEALIKNYQFEHLIHFGHPSFRKEIFKKYRYSTAPRGQDLGFIESILVEHISNIRIYQYPLTCYSSNDSIFFKKLEPR